MPRRLDNDSEKISASEINKFSYCPYQWYYERKYGKKHLVFLRKEVLEKLNKTDATKSNFVKGQRFHENYSIKPSRKRYFSIFIGVVVVILLLAFVFLFYEDIVEFLLSIYTGLIF